MEFRKAMSRKRYVKMMRAKMTEAYLHMVIDVDTLNEFYKRLRGNRDNWIMNIAKAQGYPKNIRVNYREEYDNAAARSLTTG